jgi:Protein of unknown function (DUF2510)
MELPPSGWYPDPYGVSGLLRWWDGSTWTQHTHPTGGADATDGVASGASGAQAASGAGGQQPTVQPTTVQPGVQATTVQPSVQAASVQPTTVQSSVRPTVYQPAVTSVQPTTVQPSTVQPSTAQPATAPPGGPGTDANGTQVLFLGDEAAWSAPGGPGRDDERYGYYRARRRRRMWQMGGLAGGTAVALGLIALVVTNLGNAHPAPTASKTPTKPAVTTPPPSPTPSQTPSATLSAPPITDGISGLSYTALPTWQPTCPTTLSQGFPWSGGESAVAGQVNNGQTTWYAEACSAPLPQQYGYNGVADLQSVTTNLVNQFTSSYYNGLSHGYRQEANRPITISGHAAWEIKYLITYQDTQGLPFTDEEGAVVVADLGTGAAPAVFFTSIPNNPGAGAGNVNSLVSSLRLTVPIQPGGGGSPSDGSPAAGSPGPGGSPGD